MLDGQPSDSHQKTPCYHHYDHGAQQEGWQTRFCRCFLVLVLEECNGEDGIQFRARSKDEMFRLGRRMAHCLDSPFISHGIHNATSAFPSLKAPSQQTTQMRLLSSRRFFQWCSCYDNAHTDLKSPSCIRLISTDNIDHTTKVLFRLSLRIHTCSQQDMVQFFLHLSLRAHNLGGRLRPPSVVLDFKSLSFAIIDCMVFSSSYREMMLCVYFAL